MTQHLRALPRERMEFDGGAQTRLSLRAGRHAFGQMLVHENTAEGDWSVIDVATSGTLKALDMAAVATFVRAQLPQLSRLTDDNVLRSAHATAALSVDGDMKTYRLGSARERRWFVAALARTEDSGWFCRVDVHSENAGGTMWLMRGGWSGPEPRVAVGRYGAWPESLAQWTLDHHANAARLVELSALEVAAQLEHAFTAISTAHAVDEAAVARNFHLRTFPVAVRGLGRAAQVAGVDDAAALTEYAQRRGALAVFPPGSHALDRDGERSAVLAVSLAADARAYPRSINGVPLRILRMPAPQVQAAELAG